MFFLHFLFFCSFFLLLTKLSFFFMMLFFCKSCAMMPSGGSQVDIADVCWGGGLIQLIQTFPTGPSLCLLLLLLLLPPLTQAAHQHTLDLLLTLFENILQCNKQGRISCKNICILICYHGQEKSENCRQCKRNRGPWCGSRGAPGLRSPGILND